MGRLISPETLHVRFHYHIFVVLALLPACTEPPPTHIVLPCADVQAKKEAALRTINDNWKIQQNQIDLQYASARGTGSANHAAALGDLRRAIYKQLEDTERKFNAQCPAGSTPTPTTSPAPASAPPASPSPTT